MRPGGLVWSIRNGKLPIFLKTGRQISNTTQTTHGSVFSGSIPGNSNVVNSEWHRSLQTYIAWSIFAGFPTWSSKFKRIVQIHIQQPTVRKPLLSQAQFPWGPLFTQKILSHVCFNTEVNPFLLLPLSGLVLFPPLTPILFFVSVLSNNSVTLSLTLNSCIYFEQSLFTPSYFQSVRKVYQSGSLLIYLRRI